MNFSDKSLVRKLALVLVLKLAVLVALWWVFVRDQRVLVNAESVAAQYRAPVLATEKGSKP